MTPRAATKPEAVRVSSVLVLAVALGLLTVAVAAGRWPVSLDRSLASALPGPHAAGSASVLLALASAVTTLATPQATLLLTCAAAAWLARRERHLAAVQVVTVPLVALAISVLSGKALLRRSGPPGSHLHHLFGYYPSGHTTTAVVCSGLLVRLAAPRCPGRRDVLRGAAAIWTLLVGTSLVFHRYHWLSDVVAGLLLGCLILQATSRVSRNLSGDHHTGVAAGGSPRKGL